jgi:hypothetical protein
MMVKLSVSVFVCCLFLAQTTLAKAEMDETCSAADGTCSSSSIAAKALQCGIYMAPSTLGEETNMGIYTGLPRAKDDVVVKEIAVPLLFREWGTYQSQHEEKKMLYYYGRRAVKNDRFEEGSFFSLLFMSFTFFCTLADHPAGYTDGDLWHR